MEQTQLASKVLDLNKVFKFVLRRSVFWHRNGIFKITIQKQPRTNVSLSGFWTRGRSVGPKFQTSLQSLPNVDYCNNVNDRCRNASQHIQVPIPCHLFLAFFPGIMRFVSPNRISVQTSELGTVEWFGERDTCELKCSSICDSKDWNVGSSFGIFQGGNRICHCRLESSSNRFFSVIVVERVLRA